MKNRIETAWIMAEIKPYSFESMRDSSESEEDDLHESQDERQRGRGITCLCHFWSDSEADQPTLRCVT